MYTVHPLRFMVMLALVGAISLDASSARAQRRIVVGGNSFRVDDDNDDSESDVDNERRSSRRRSSNRDRGEAQPEPPRNSSGRTAQEELQRFLPDRSRGSRTRLPYGQPVPTERNRIVMPEQFESGDDSDLRRRGAIKIGNWSEQFGKSAQPFSAKWYESHPDAWRHSQPQADMWADVPSEGVASWLGWEGAAAPSDARIVIPGTRRPVSGRFDPSRYGQWLPLGVFMLMSSPDDNTRLVQLAVDRAGTIRGVYYDAITDASYNVTGRMHRDAQDAHWSLRNNPNVSFRARLSDLLNPFGRVRVYLPGDTQRWDLVRVER